MKDLIFSLKILNAAGEIKDEYINAETSNNEKNGLADSIHIMQKRSEKSRANALKFWML
ncbi:hypothetical protein [Desulfobacter latus]|uniref:Uncharacterized protein n=1 Tax=Desulfobacter latus TaxID=2292 RepID=A0A850TBP3_9BACT|nr:hypothetical protein [Desulfobacter latus]NWH05657.1 hypothetical protein [Desulfobacter latus]